MCTGCRESKPLDEFTKDSKTADGKAWKCRACAEAVYRIWLAANPERPAMSARKYYRANVDVCRRKAREAARVKRQAAGIRTRAQRIADDKAARVQKDAQPLPENRACSLCHEIKPIEHFARSKDVATGRVLQCRDCRSRSKATWAQSRVEWLAAYDNLYRLLHPEIVANNGRRRRARKLNAPGEDHTPEQVQALWRASGGVCANPYCRVPIAKGSRHLDHIMPLARGGSNSIDNLQWLCNRCNRQKHAKTPEEWHAWLVRKHHIG